MVQGGMRCVKYLLFAFNLVFFIAGLGMIICGAVVQTKFSAYFDFVDMGGFNAVASFLIVVGVIIFVIGFFGCCGAYRENYCMVMTYAVLLGLVLLLQIVAAIVAYAMRSQVKNWVSKGMSGTLKNYNQEGKEGVTKMWNSVQHDFKCCGVTNYTDWGDNANYTGNNDVPDTCCKKSIDGCGIGQRVAGISNSTIIYTKGCLYKLDDLVAGNIGTIGGVAIGLAFIQIIGVVCACCLARTIKKEYEVV